MKQTTETRNIMTLLTAAHLPLLTAKLVELEAVALHISSSPGDTAFRNNYTHENGLDKVAYDAEFATSKAKYAADWDANYKNREDVKVAIAECEKQISISNALSLLL
jgi:hypothetical protein